jgi:glutathione peroxidase
VSLDHLIPVRTYVNAMEAEVARSALEAAGIHAVVRRDDCGGVRPSLWLTGVDLLVRPFDRDAADAILTTPALYVTADEAGPSGSPPRSVYDFSATTLDGRRVSLELYRGSVLLIVNVASYCGYTRQYRDLESLYRAHANRGFAVLGFPCDQFGRQEPGTHEEIRAFCSDTFGITFPMFAKINVNGEHAHPLYAFLKAQKKGWLGTAGIKWNFSKFLVDRAGQVVGRYGPADAPVSIEPDVVDLLALEPAERGERQTS